MDRILRAAPGWEEWLSDALAHAARPIPFDDRLLPRRPGGERSRRRREPGAPSARAAATLLALVPGTDGGIVVPLTVRRSDLRSHPGEVSLPGGAVDPGDASPRDAALREAWEEIGLHPSAVRIVGALDEVWIPVSNFELRPFVGVVAHRPTWVPHDREVATIVEFPLAALFDPDALVEEEFEGRGWRVRAGAYRYGDVLVWGATALTLGMLAHVLREAEFGRPAS
jgi:8-oxo-dGTP pyrophosphatase MutT (NUDIX family)